MPVAADDQMFAIFFAVWVVLGIGSAAFFFFSKDASLKRKVWTPFAVGAGALFLGFVWLMGFPAEQMYVAVPVVALITFVNLRTVQFCDSFAAKRLLTRIPFPRQHFAQSVVRNSVSDAQPSVRVDRSQALLAGTLAAQRNRWAGGFYVAGGPNASVVMCRKCTGKLTAYPKA
jgi:hypothetical protein